MAKTKAEEPVKQVYEQDFYSDADTLANRAKQIASVTPSTAIDILALARDAQRRLKVEVKAKTAELEKQFKPFEDQKRKLNAAYTTAELAAKQRLEDLILEKGVDALPDESDNGTQISPIAVHTYEVTDELLTFADVPVQFRLPAAQCIDWGKVAAAHAAKDVLPKFVKIVTTYTLRTKLPEVIEE